MMYRQGDVLIVKIDQIPNNVQLQEGPVILAYGEVTGHKHQIKDDNKAILFAANDNKYLRIVEDTLLTHEEHDPIKLPTGDYLIIIQREYTPEEIRYVAD